MAEIIDTSAASSKDIPQDQKDWAQARSKSGATYTYSATDENGKTVEESKDKEAHAVDASGPRFDNHKVEWRADGKEHNTDAETQAKTAIYKYKFTDDGAYHYTLEFWTKDSYNYTFFSRVDSYQVDVYNTWWSHSVGFYTKDSEITSISGR